MNKEAAMRKGLAAMVGLAGLAVAPGTASAQATVCTVSVHVAFAQPIGLQQTTGAVRSTREGSVTCAGDVAGSSEVRDGAIAINGVYGSDRSSSVWGDVGDDTCATGHALLDTTIRLAPGYLSGKSRPIELTGRLGLNRVGVAVNASGGGTIRNLGAGRGWKADGSGSFTPDAGQDCVVNPWRSGTYTLAFSIKGVSAQKRR